MNRQRTLDVAMIVAELSLQEQFTLWISRCRAAADCDIYVIPIIIDEMSRVEDLLYLPKTTASICKVLWITFAPKPIELPDSLLKLRDDAYAAAVDNFCRSFSKELTNLIMQCPSTTIHDMGVVSLIDAPKEIESHFNDWLCTIHENYPAVHQAEYELPLINEVRKMEEGDTKNLLTGVLQISSMLNISNPQYTPLARSKRAIKEKVEAWVGVLGGILLKEI